MCKKYEISFPVIKAIPIEKQDSGLKKVLKFGSFRRRYRVMENYICWSEYLNKSIFIPRGFIFDGASIPKAISFLYSPTGVLFYGALPHDYGYKYNGLHLVEDLDSHIINFHKFSKTKLDKIFKELCIQESGMKFSSIVATFALSCFGFLSWKSHRSKDVKK